MSLAVRGGLSQREPTDASLAPDVTYDGDAPYELPKGWRWQRLGELQPEFQNGAASRGDAGGQPITVLRLADIRNRRVSLAATRTVPIRREDIEKYLLRDGDILITRVNGSADIVGQFNLVEGEPQAIYCDHFIRLRVNRQVLEPHYLALFASCDIVRKRIGDLFISTAGQKTVNQGHIASLPIAIPPLRDQARIVACVDELMQLCDALEAKGRLEAQQHARLLETLLGGLTDSTTPEELAANWQRVAEHFDLLLDRPEAVDVLEQTVLQLAVRGLLVPQNPIDEPASVQLRHIAEERARLISAGVIKRSKPVLPVAKEEQPFVLPRGWEWARLEQLSLAIVDCPHSTPKFVDSGILCIDTNSFKGGVLLPHKLRYVDQATYQERIDRLAPAPGDLVFAREGSVGESVIIPPGTTACLGQRVMLFRFFHHVSNEFIRLAITTPLFLKGLLDLHKGIGAKHVNVGDMRMAIVSVPPMAEQLRVLKRVAELRRLCADLRQRLTASQATQSRLAEALVDQVA